MGSQNFWIIGVLCTFFGIIAVGHFMSPVKIDFNAVIKNFDKSSQPSLWLEFYPDSITETITVTTEMDKKGE